MPHFRLNSGFRDFSELITVSQSTSAQQDIWPSVGNTAANLLISAQSIT